MVHNPLDLTVPLEMLDSNTCQRAVDLQPFDEDALADEAEGGNLLHDTVVQWLVEGDGVLGLIFDLSLGPLLLFRRLSAARG